MMTLLLLAKVPTAGAWEYISPRYGGIPGSTCTDVTWGGNTVSYQFGTTFFNNNQEDAIKDGLDAWDAGPGTVNRGAQFNYEVSVLLSASPSLTNTNNELFTLTTAQGISAFAAPSDWLAYGPSTADAACSFIVAADIVYNSDANWFVVLPSRSVTSASSGWSLAAVTTHEAGHNMGLAHEPDIEGVMWRHHYAENGTEIRLGEDDYNALTSLHPHSSLGRNLMLSKFQPVGTQSVRPVEEGWTADEAATWTQDVCGSVPVQQGPREVLASVNGTGGPYSGIPMEWTLSLDSTCFNSDDITIGTRTPTVSTNSPYRVGPSGGEYDIPTSTPDGDYYVCAGINPDQTYSEAQSSFDDNIVQSEGLWSIDCP